MMTLSKRRAIRLNHWRQLQKAKAAATPKPDALQKALAGVMPIAYDGNPLKDLGWMPVEEYENVRLLRMAWREYEEGWIPEELGLYSLDGPVATFKNGVRVDLNELKAQQHRTAYELLRKGASVEEVSAAIHRPQAWVEAVRQEFNL
jgi:hypothetical protein